MSFWMTLDPPSFQHATFFAPTCQKCFAVLSGRVLTKLVNGLQVGQVGPVDSCGQVGDLDSSLVNSRNLSRVGQV